jgi:spermidine synthase
MNGQWVDEIHEDHFRLGLRSTETLFSEKSPYQHVEIVDTISLGRALRLDGIWMCAEGDEKSYHEMIVHPALTSAPKIARVLVIGGGDGGTVREVLKYPEVQHVDMVEIDEVVVRACQEHLQAIGTAWSDPRLNVMIEDGIKYVEDTDAQPYDVIIVDGSDPVGPAEGLFDRAFYAACADRLTPGGVFVTQAESPLSMKKVHVEMIQALQTVFSEVHPYYGGVMIYPGGAWSWVYASQGTDHQAIVTARAERIEQESMVYTREVHRGSFAIPNHIRRLIGGT